VNRRSFLRSAAQIGIAGSLATPSYCESQAAPTPPTVPDPALWGVGPRAIADYFSDEMMFEALGTRKLAKPKVQVIAYNFPSWHASPYMEKYFGKGWTEYDTLKNARKLFPEHSMPHFPLWGYYDESDPVWAAKEVDLASTYGVDAWMVDWYWHAGTQFYHEQIENGLLKAPNKDKLKFAIMWANHHWKNVYPAAGPDEAAILLPQVHTFKDFENVANYCCERYFNQSNYLQMDGKPVFAIFDPNLIIDQLGVDGLKRSLNIMRERAGKMGFSGLHMQASHGYLRHEAELKSFGFDSATMYSTFAWSYGVKPRGSRLPYGVGAREGITAWTERRSKTDVPFFPVCSVGWDDSPRYEENAAIAINRSPDQFERVVRAARHFLAQNPGDKWIYIGAWNEWTEDHMLLPDTLWGYSYLEALHRAVKT
jgi:hypothetical protein